MASNTPRGTVRLAGAPDSWGVWFADDPQQPHWKTFLDEVTEAGYRSIELGPWGYLPTDPAVLRQELDQRGLELAGVTVIQPLEDPENWPVLEAEVRATATLGQQFGVEHLVLIESSFAITEDEHGARTAPRISPEGWKAITDTVKRIGAWIKDEWGMTLVFHPHADSFVEREREIERLLEDVPAEHMQLCLDTGHHAYGGGDSVAFYSKHAHRVAHLHLKDVDPAVLKTVRDEMLDLGEAVAREVMVEPGKGTIDFRELREALRIGGYEGWAVVEQDIYPAPPEKALPIAKRTISYLTEAGFDR
jgi:inosose dehydratase